MRLRRPSMTLAAAALFAACGADTTSSQPRSEPMPERDDLSTANKATIRGVYERCINAGELDLLDQLVAPEFVGPNGETGPAGMRSTFAALRVAFPDIRYTLEDLFAEGDHVAVRWTWEGTHTAPIRGFPAHGTRVKDAGMAIYELRGGKIERVSLQTDRLGFLQQIGVVPDDAGLRAGAARTSPADAS
jgi:steroid delta-isomerase-like uncharacterized protein